MYKPPFTISNLMLEYLDSITKKINDISIYTNFDKLLNLKRNNKIMSIHSSLAIEANSLSINQIREIIDGKKVLGSKKEIQEVLNAYKVYEMINEFDAYNQKDLLKTHGILTSLLNDDAGKYRKHQEGVFNGNQVIFIAPPYNIVPSLMNDLFMWLKDDQSTPLIIKSCIFHYELIFIHPFSDGNGRIARFWQNILLIKCNKLFEYIPIEQQIKEYQDEYYDVISTSNNLGNSNLFIEFMLRMIDKSLDRVVETIRTIYK